MSVFLFGAGIGAGAVGCWFLARLIAWCAVLVRKLTQPGPRQMFLDSYQTMRSARTRNGYGIPAPWAAYFAARFIVAVP